MKLSECQEGSDVVISSINFDGLTLKRMELLGLKAGRRITVAKASKGSVLIVYGGKMVAIGKRLSEEVEVVCE